MRFSSFLTVTANKQNKQRKQKVILLFFFFFLFSILPLIAQTSPSAPQKKLKIGILPVANNTPLAYIDTLTETVQDDMFFTANQIERFKVIDSRSVRLTDPRHLARLRLVSKQKRCDFLISGEITQAGGAYSLTLILFDAREKNPEDGKKGIIRAVKQEAFYRLIDIFPTSERLALILLGELAGERIKQGTILFVNTNQTPGTSFTVIINNKTLEENTPSVTLVEGTYSVRVFDTTSKRKQILNRRITVKEGEPQRVEFELKQKAPKENSGGGNYSKKNTIRTNAFGLSLLFATDQTLDNNLMGGGMILPEFSYTRLFTDTVGANIAFALITTPDRQEDSVGFEISAGPHFRIGRIGLTPMIGGTIHFLSQDYTQYSFFDFVNKADIPGDASFIFTGEILLGIDFFFTPTVSLYGEIGLAAGGHQFSDVEPGSVTNYQYFLIGFTCGIGIGISF